MNKNQKNMLVLGVLVLIVALVLSGVIGTGNNIVTGVKVEVITDKAVVMHSIIAAQNIFANLPSGAFDITSFLPGGVAYYGGERLYMKLSPQVTTAFTASSNNTEVDYRCVWNYVKYPKETNTLYAWCYPIIHIANPQGPVTFQYFTDSGKIAQKSGEVITIDGLVPLLVSLSSLTPLPTTTQTYTCEFQLIVTALLYVDGSLVSNSTQTATAIVTFSASGGATGAISMLSVGFTVDKVVINH